MAEYESILNHRFDAPDVAHGVKHFIPTEGPPVFSRPRRLDPEKLMAAKAAFEKLLKEGIIRRSSSPWASPLHVVKKPDGTL